MKEVKERNEVGIKVGGKVIGDVRFADDQAMAADTNNGLQQMMQELNETAKGYGMKINIKKTKVMVVSKRGDVAAEITLDGEKIERVNKYKYLGVWITEDGRCELEVKTRIALAKEAFAKRRELLTRGLRKETKKRIIKALVWSVALYGCETWTLRMDEKRRLEALEMWLWRRMEKISWTEHISNDEVFRRVGEKRILLDKIVERQKNWIGHILRGDGLMRDVIEGRMEGQRTRGRRRIGMLDILMEGDKYHDMKRRAQDRETWRSWTPRTCLRTEH